MIPIILKKFASKFAKFSVVGMIVTSFSLSTNFILLKFFETQIYLTYTTVYLITILLSFILNSVFTFKTELKFSNLLIYYGLYISGMLLGLFLIYIYKSIFSFENWVYPFMSLPFTMTWNFLMANKFLSKT